MHYYTTILMGKKVNSAIFKIWMNILIEIGNLKWNNLAEKWFVKTIHWRRSIPVSEPESPYTLTITLSLRARPMSCRTRSGTLLHIIKNFISLNLMTLPEGGRMYWNSYIRPPSWSGNQILWCLYKHLITFGVEEQKFNYTACDWHLYWCFDPKKNQSTLFLYWILYL